MPPTTKQVYKFLTSPYLSYFLPFFSTKNLISINDYSMEFSVLIAVYMYASTWKA